MDELGDHILKLIFSYLKNGPKDWFLLSEVCKRWRNIIVVEKDSGIDYDRNYIKVHFQYVERSKNDFLRLPRVIQVL